MPILSVAERTDAEYFHPAKQGFLDRLRSMPGKPLGAHFRSVSEMFDPTAASPGAIVRNFDLGDALQPVLDDTKEPMSARAVGSAKKRFAAGDVVTSRLRGYLRETALVRTTATVPSVGSSEFMVLRPHDPERPSLSQAALLAFLRSQPVQTILQWSQDDSHHPRYGDDDLLAIAAPRIDALIESILLARARARTLLAQAQLAVEIAIEKNESAALDFLTSGAR